MRKDRLYSLLVTAALIAPAPAALADDIPGTSYVSGNWSGAAETDANGQFLDCYVTVGFVNGEEFWVGLYDDDSLTVYMTAPGASYEPGRSYDASLMTEVGYPVHGTAFGADSRYIGFTLVGLDDSIDYLTQGSYIRLLGVGIDQSLDVRGLGGALSQARACLAVNGSGGRLASAPGLSPSEPSTPDTGKAETGVPPVLGVGGGGGAKPVQMSKPMNDLRPPPRGE